jgi:hypothetical protein
VPKRKRVQREHTEDWQTIQQYTIWPARTGTSDRRLHRKKRECSTVFQVYAGNVGQSWESTISQKDWCEHKTGGRPFVLLIDSFRNVLLMSLFVMRQIATLRFSERRFLPLQTQPDRVLQPEAVQKYLK